MRRTAVVVVDFALNPSGARGVSTNAVKVMIIWGCGAEDGMVCVCVCVRVCLVNNIFLNLPLGWDVW